MLSLNSLKDLVNQAKQSIESINYTNLVVDDSQLVSLLRQRKTTDNNMLIAVVPQYGINGEDSSIKFNNQLIFMLLKKYTDKDVTLDNQINYLEETRSTIYEFVKFLLLKKLNGNCTICDEIIENSILVTPIWEKAQCSGWMLQLDLETPF